MFIRMVLAKMGSILVRILTPSTCVTVHTFHCSGSELSGSMAALSRNLVSNLVI